MSTFLRAILFVVAWLLFAFTTFTFCIVPECCSEEESVIVDPPPPPPPAVSNDYAVVSKLNDKAVLNGALWPDLRTQLLNQYRSNPGQKLDIYGHYYSDEPTPAGFENMGFYRADEIKKLLVPDIPADDINVLSRRLDRDKPAADELWVAGTFDWKADAGGDVPPITELDKDEIIIRFPFNESTKTVAPAVDAYLTKLAKRLQETEENVAIVGHTDNVDSDAFNMRLGQKRADFIKDLLVKKGAPANRIRTSSDGESNPVATNETVDGRQQNRRSVVKLNRQ